MEVTVYSQRGLETHGLLIRLLRVITVPLLNYISPSTLQKFMRASSRDASAVMQNVGYTHALEIIYTRYHRKLFSRGFRQGIADFFWHHCTSQAKALRNRLKIVEHILDSEIAKRVHTHPQGIFNILTVGGGSSRAITHSLYRNRKKYQNLSVRVTNIDKDGSAIDLGKKISREHNLDELFYWIQDDARNIETHVMADSTDIVEMVGLLDYFSHERGVEIISHIYRVLKPGGIFIVANVYPNNEQKFLHNMGWPAMYYRGPETVKRILKESGFSREPTIIFEPLKLHIIIVVEK